jgi:ABC-type phosphate transport system auxiliary subunit
MTTQTLIDRLCLGASISRERGLNLDFADVAEQAAAALEAQAAELGYLQQELEHAINSTFTRKLDACQADCETLKREHDSLRAEIETLKADASRYQVLRNIDYQHHEDDISVCDSNFNAYFGDDLDKEVDALRIRHVAITQQNGEQ